MPRYEIRATADLEPGARFDVADIRAAVGGEVEHVSADVLSVVVTAETSSPDVAARDIVAALQGVSRCGIWTTRRLGVLGLGRRRSGRWAQFGDDDGLGGVREPRRPLPSSGSASAAVELPGG
jgi:hypothetical protein